MTGSLFSSRTAASLARGGRRGLDPGPAPNVWRGLIVEKVRASPGILQAELAAALGCNRGTLRHHLETLSRNGALHMVRHGQRSAVFPAGPDARDRAAWAVLQRGRTRELASLVRSLPGVTQADVAARLGFSRKILRKYADRMLDHGLMREERGARWMTYHPTPALARLLDLVERFAPAEAATGTSAPGQAPTAIVTIEGSETASD